MYISYRKEKGRDKMSNYFDNQQKWSFNVTPGESVFVTTDHGDHTHTLDISHVSIGDMEDNTGQVMGDAHREASHDFKESNEEMLNGDLSSDDESIDIGGEECEDGLDI